MAGQGEEKFAQFVLGRGVFISEARTLRPYNIGVLRPAGDRASTVGFALVRQHFLGRTRQELQAVAAIERGGPAWVVLASGAHFLVLDF